MKLIGWISPQGEYSEKPLLGMSSSEYVARAMAGCGASMAVRCGSFENADVALVVRSDAPGLTTETLQGLASVTAGMSARPSVLMAQNLQTPLAVAMDMETLQAATEGESALPSVDRIIENLNGKGVALRVWHDGRSDTYYTVEDAQGFAEAFSALNAVNVQKHMAAGVIVLSPDRVVIEDGVKLGKGTMIYAGNLLCGHTVVGQNCMLYPGNRLLNATVGDGATIESSVLLDCAVGRGACVGPFAYLRAQTKVGDHCRVGGFVETGNSTLGEGAKVAGLSSIIGSDVGKNARLGHGVALVSAADADGRCIVDDDATIGCNCNLIAPAHIGKNAYLAAGSTVVEDVPADALFVARPRGVVKENWDARTEEP